MKVAKSDIFMFLGLLLMGGGLFLWVGIGIAMVVTGGIILILGFLDALIPEEPKED